MCCVLRWVTYTSLLIGVICEKLCSRFLNLALKSNEALLKKKKRRKKEMDSASLL